ncbi:MAG TPA: class I SAM-dependent methyltransferase [Anaerolineae bacterium]
MLGISRWFYDLTYRFSTPRWDNGRIPPELGALVESGGVRGNALDLGCGTGTQSLYLARHGLNVVGVDFSATAIERAREQARRAGTPVDFHTADVTDLEFLRTPFDLVLDIGCLHGLDAAGQHRYARNLARLTQAGSVFLLYAFDRHGALGIGVTAKEVERHFAPPFAVREVRQGTYLGGRMSFCYRLERVGAHAADLRGGNAV